MIYNTYCGATSSSVYLETENEINCETLSNVKSTLNDPHLLTDLFYMANYVLRKSFNQLYPKVKLGQVGSNIAQNHSSSP